MTPPEATRASEAPCLRVALLTGGLWKGGAEKQLCYMSRALLDHGVDVRVYTLSTGGFYERPLADAGVPVIWVGRHEHPILRLARLYGELRRFKPHVVQTSHFYVNLYAALMAPLLGAVAIGSVRNDVVLELEANGMWGRWLLRAPAALLVNSEAARRHASTLGVPSDRIQVLPNVIEPEQPPARPGERHEGDVVLVVGVSRLVAMKRLDRFLRVVARAREHDARIQARVVGDGPERERLAQLALALGLGPEAVTFAGHQEDVSAELARADILLHASDHEGFPNALLEAMIAGLPVVTTPAGDAGIVVEHGETGYVVPFHDERTMACRLLELARSPELRSRLGAAGSARAQRHFGYAGLDGRLVRAYETFARQQGRDAAAHAIAAKLRAPAASVHAVDPPPT